MAAVGVAKNLYQMSGEGLTRDQEHHRWGDGLIYLKTHVFCRFRRKNACLLARKQICLFLSFKIPFLGRSVCTVLAKENKYFLTFRLNDHSPQNNNKQI